MLRPHRSTCSSLTGSGTNPTTFIAQTNTNAVATYGNQVRMPSSGSP